MKASTNEDHSSSAASKPSLHTKQQDDAPHLAVAKVFPLNIMNESF